MNHFINKGYGWMCLRCQPQDRPAADEGLARFMREGEAEARETRLSSSLAKWADQSREKLICPRCGAEENIDAGHV
jgi:ribosomal protein L40E